MTKKFEDLRAFNAAVDLMVDVYETTCVFPKHELYGLTSQIRRAAVSVVSQIAEGQGRLSPGEWRQLLSQARGSLYEVEAEIIASRRLKYVDEATYERLRQSCTEVGSPLAGLIRYVQHREQLAKPHRGNRQRATGNSAQ
jgi:four helix bundle protein